MIDLNLEPIGHCGKCARRCWKAETIGKVDEMLRPDETICGGRFVADAGVAP
jgi:hypothetical protein